MRQVAAAIAAIGVLVLVLGATPALADPISPPDDPSVGNLLTETANEWEAETTAGPPLKVDQSTNELVVDPRSDGVEFSLQDSGSSTTLERGVEFKPDKTDLDAIYVEFPAAQDVSQVAVYDDSGTQLGSTSVSSSDSSAIVSASMSAGQTYYVEAVTDSTYYADQSPGLSKSDGTVFVTNGSSDQSSVSGETYVFSTVAGEVPLDGGTATYFGDVYDADIDRGVVGVGTYNGSIDVTVEDFNTGNTVGSATLTSDGHHEIQAFSQPQNGLWRLVIDAPRGTRLSYAGVRFPNDAPQLSNPDPNNEEATSSPLTLSVDVNDSQFGYDQGDSVTVEFYDAEDGSLIGSDTRSSNGTASVEWSGAAGENEWYAIATDEYGAETDTRNTFGSTFTFTAPGQLEIRDEESQDLLENVDVTIEFYQQGDVEEIYTREATNGTVSMDGLPADENFIAVAEAENFTNRRIFIDSLLETQTIYLRSDDADTVAIDFELDDFSGQFDQSTSVLIIERSINGTWTPIQGDFFGATGRFEAQLALDTRHRMRIRNLATGEERRVGTLTPQSSGTQTVTIQPDGEIQISEAFEQISLRPAISAIPAADAAEFGIEIVDGDQEIVAWNITIEHVAPDGSTEILETTSGEGPGTEQYALNLTDREGSVVATVEYETANRTGEVVLSRSIREHYPAADGLLGGLLDIGVGLGISGPDGDPNGVSALLSLIVATLVTAGVASSTRASPETMGLVALGSLFGFLILGWLPIGALVAAAVTFGTMLVLRRGF